MNIAKRVILIVAGVVVGVVYATFAVYVAVLLWQALPSQSNSGLPKPSIFGGGGAPG